MSNNEIHIDVDNKDQEAIRSFIKGLRQINIKDYKNESNKNDDPEPELNRIFLNFYGCSFNFAKDGCSESRYYNGDDVYVPQNERM